MTTRRGQALVMLLVFVAVALVISAMAITILIIGYQGSAQLAASQTAWAVAESGVENALLRLLRDPNYSGETLTIGSDTATITVAGANSKIIDSIGVAGEFSRHLRATAIFTNGVMTVSSWQEVF